MRDLGLVKVDEPFKKLLTQGMVLNTSTTRKTPQGGISTSGRTKLKTPSTPTARSPVPSSGRRLGHRVRRRGHHVEIEEQRRRPAKLIDTMGADTARLFTMFASPPEQTLEWNDAGVKAHRFVKPRVELWCRNLSALNGRREFDQPS